MNDHSRDPQVYRGDDIPGSHSADSVADGSSQHQNMTGNNANDTTGAPPTDSSPNIFGDAGDANVMTDIEKTAEQSATDTSAKETVATLATPPAEVVEPTNDIDAVQQYTLTVAEMRACANEAGRKVHSSRTYERYCKDEGHPLKCLKVKTTTGQEWLANEESFQTYLAGEPVVEKKDVEEPTSRRQPDSEAEEVMEPIGETRSVGQVLYENAKLLGTNQTLERTIAQMEMHNVQMIETLQREIDHHRKMQVHPTELARVIIEEVRKITTSGNLARAAEAGVHLDKPKEEMPRSHDDDQRA